MKTIYPAGGNVEHQEYQTGRQDHQADQGDQVDQNDEKTGQGGAIVDKPEQK